MDEPGASPFLDPRLIAGTEQDAPVSEGIRLHLAGTRCAACDRVFFPPMDSCAACGRRADPIAFASDATLRGFTSVLHPPPGAEVEVPYDVGVAEFPEGIAVMGLLVGDAEGEPTTGEPVETVATDLDTRMGQLRDWQRRIYDAGFLGLGWPEDYGGSGGTLLDRIVFNQELARSHAPLPAGLVSLEVVGPTILEYGTEAQRRRFVPPLLRGDEMWCQGFSEPEAGSDLAALRTRAERDGDEYVVTGQKVWTSWAQYSSWCAVLVRTDPDAPKHRGITYLLVDMDDPGLIVRPLEQMTGDPEFSELFLDEVRVPVDNVLGEPNDGWRVALATLGYERGPFTLRQQVLMRVALDDLVAELVALADDGDTRLEDPLVLRALGEVELLVEVFDAAVHATVTRLLAGDADPGESSLDKLFLAEVEQAVHAFALDLLGPARTVTGTDGLDRTRWIHDYLYSRAASIYGGTSQIQRNIVSTRVLDLPRS